MPPDFVFAVKGPRYITHMKKLVDVEAPLGTFLASGVLSLGERLGPVLWQLPPHLGFHPDRLSAFFDLLPRSTGQASAYAAAHHDASKLKEPADTTTPVDRPLRHVVEARHDSFRTPAFCELLRAHDIGMVVADSAGTWPMFDEVTSDVAYVRLHGDVELYTSGYSPQALDHWAAQGARLGGPASTSSSTSTTTPRSTHRSTRWPCRSGSAPGPRPDGRRSRTAR